MCIKGALTQLRALLSPQLQYSNESHKGIPSDQIMENSKSVHESKANVCVCFSQSISKSSENLNN